MPDSECLLASLEAHHYMIKGIPLLQPCYRRTLPQLQNTRPRQFKENAQLHKCAIVRVVHFFEFRNGFVLYEIDARHQWSGPCALPQMHCEAAAIPAPKDGVAIAAPSTWILRTCLTEKYRFQISAMILQSCSATYFNTPIASSIRQAFKAHWT